MSTTTTPALDPEVLRARLDRAGAAAANADLDALLVTPGSDLRYLLGVGGESFERLSCLVLPAAGASGAPALVLPKLEEPGYAHVPTDALGVEVVTWVDGEDPYQIINTLLRRGGATPRQLAVADMMPALHALRLRDAVSGAHQVLAGPVIRELRMRKDAAEIAGLRKAGEAIDRVHTRIAEWLRPGRTEAEVGADIAEAIVAEGHTEAAFVIVGSGPNGASPHHDLSDRRIEVGDVVVVDIGGPVAEGYNSDCTRTYVIGEPAFDDVRATYAVLQAAQEAAVAAVRPGVTAEQIDAAARSVIADAGFGEYFVHRTGHGIGLDVHEEPYIVAGNDLVLEPGMAFSVEPGIYLPGRWGARIEDIVVVTEDGVERLNNTTRDLVSLPA
ncbi:Xaa-Pro dipeptidase [Streptoalloteichus tenebrarius]|uniref:Xaa-Pro dipeptidase n=1 Tax=Streptoalloteichus tenebrarius (strain ATCC 17920 / DSM 40477 / JCM 4838 / CBS 697.72 / NBRC 16177 / NCIMB 11028 / NRRL B-12390 / A12253. 1 / ISP 5477) TaxID=1933 RepID=A0ABT1HRM6_STRSD|nr:Xaa-Pro peptidase family protein [Streptoalloteichus tenebrarius]MCP2258176.1 Xaa-Pro dipeptidase [Streptoalloteichus tenebrarius]BFF04598.1 Xaa-Pro peptidase family protein [Streptoalloteichus tenebrarius]